jgi:GH15 family glucan-1,4-alpha-glucosidase
MRIGDVEAAMLLEDYGLIGEVETAAEVGRNGAIKLACAVWLVSASAVNGHVTEARALFERLLEPANDLRLRSEGDDVGRKRPVSHYPQAFFHLTLNLAAYAISAGGAKASSAGLA